MCLIPLFLFPTTLIEELLLVVEAVNDLGAGVAGLSVLASMHTPPIAVDFRMEGKTLTHSSLMQTFFLSPRVAKRSGT